VINNHWVTGHHYLFSAIIPLLGIILGIVAMAKNEVGPGLALLATSIVCSPIALVLWYTWATS